MKTKYLLLCLGLLGGCGKSPQEKAEGVVKDYFTHKIGAARGYEPLKITHIAAPIHSHAPPQAGEEWFVNRYVLTDLQGRSEVREDTVVVKQDGQVLFY